MTDEDIFGTNPIAEEQVEATPEAVEPEPVAEQPAETPVAPPVVTPEPAKPEPGHVPLSAMLDERERRQKLEAELARYQAQQAPPEPLDVYDPEQLAGYTSQQVLNTKLDISEEMTRDKFGDELVDKAREWALQRFSQDPSYQAQVLRQRNPWKHVVEQFQRDQIASQVSLSDFEQFQAWKAANATLAQQTAAPVAAQTPLVQPPPSLASAPSAGSSVQPKPDPAAETLNAMF
ncbi:hypothetical protein UFOVP368_7 [uncultured Caudovirales phage]|uniref:Uncharacterized protein n=1 Tax=uncultured Caudovirales phage TaxID=2100421 RepID=A0A6J7X0B1_9CAUD|nr:hypothetical protein UFOVP368_7 [uncultured Caudovirales phage]